MLLNYDKFIIYRPLDFFFSLSLSRMIIAGSPFILSYISNRKIKKDFFLSLSLSFSLLPISRKINTTSKCASIQFLCAFYFFKRKRTQQKNCILIQTQRLIMSIISALSKYLPTIYYYNHK